MTITHTIDNDRPGPERLSRDELTTAVGSLVRDMDHDTFLVARDSNGLDGITLVWLLNGYAQDDGEVVIGNRSPSVFDGHGPGLRQFTVVSNLTIEIQ